MTFKIYHKTHSKIILDLHEQQTTKLKKNIRYSKFNIN